MCGESSVIIGQYVTGLWQKVDVGVPMSRGILAQFVCCRSACLIKPACRKQMRPVGGPSAGFEGWLCLQGRLLLDNALMHVTRCSAPRFASNQSVYPWTVEVYKGSMVYPHIGRRRGALHRCKKR